MGSSSSKTARVASSTVRKYPSRIPPQIHASRPQNTPQARPPPESAIGPTVHPQTRSSGLRDDAVNRDASDPDLDQAFNARLYQLGPVQPSPTLSNSSTFNQSVANRELASRSNNRSQDEAQLPQSPSSFQPSASTPAQSIFPSPASNPAVSLLTARSRLAHEAEVEFENTGRKGAQGRSFLDVLTLRQVLLMRDELGTEDEEIERRLGLREGIVARLGRRGVVSGAGA